MRRHRKPLPDGQRLAACLLVLMLLLSGVGVAFSPVPVQAAPEFLRPRLVTKQFTIPDRSARQETVQCPRNFSAISGGVVPIRIEPRVYLVASAPIDFSGKPATTNDGDRPTGWFVAIKNSTRQGVQARAHVLCIPRDADPNNDPLVATHDVRLDPGPIPPGSVFLGMSGEGGVVCPDRTMPLGGGVAPLGQRVIQRTGLISTGPLAPDGVNSALAAQPGDPPSGWFANVRLDEGTAVTFRVSAVCRVPTSGTMIVMWFTDVAVTSEYGLYRAAMDCGGSGEHLTGGGMLGPTNMFSSMLALGPVPGKGKNKGASGWRSSIVNGNFLPNTYRLVVLCEEDRT